MFWFGYFYPSLAKGLCSHLCTHHHPSQQTRREHCDPWGFPLAPGLAQQPPFVFQKVAHPFPISLHFPKALESPGEQEVLLEKRKMLLTTWMVGDLGRERGKGGWVQPYPASWERCAEGGNAITHGSKGKTGESPGEEAGQEGAPLTPLSSPFYPSELFQPSNIKKNPIQLSLSCLIMSSYKALVSNLWKLWLSY